MTSKTTVDWLRFRTQAEVPDGLKALKPLFGNLAEHVGLQDFGKGKDGFKTGASVVVGDMSVGRVDFGGESQRGWVRWNLTGKGCEWVKDWDAIEEVQKLPAADLKRLDIALTTWRGEVRHDTVTAAHAAGRFTNGGRPPNMQTILHSDPEAGRTCYVGNRKSDKFFRGYEKGRELAAKFNLRGSLTHIDGFPVEDIYRCELELKAETRPISWDAVERRDSYFAGAYPFCADILPGIEPDTLQRRPERAPQTDLAAALQNIRIQYGATLFTALHAYGGDISAIWDKIVGKEHNAALVSAGVLMVDHD